MKTLSIAALTMLFFPGFLQAQITQPGNPVSVRNAPVSNRVSFSTRGNDSLRVDLVNVNVPGLEIISCTNCMVDAPWLKLNGGQIEVIIKNRGTAKSDAATAWVEYGKMMKLAKDWFIEVAATSRKGVPVLNPGQTTKLIFDIAWGSGELYKKSKIVRISLTQNGGRAWREAQ